jgi:fucose 4-O-acetylase-like acetyltransferase
MTEDSGSTPERLEAPSSVPQPPTAESGDPGKRLRFSTAVERALFTLVALSLVVGVVSALSSHAANCDASGSDTSSGPMILLFGGAGSAALAFLAYVVLLIYPRKHRSVHIAGTAAISLMILEIIAGVFWLVSNAIGCGAD